MPDNPINLPHDPSRPAPDEDRDATASQDFIRRLNEISGAGGPWSSITNLIIAANVAVFVVMGFLGAGWFETESMLPYIRYGANNGAATTDGEWWRLVTSMFMHYGVIHLALNMWALFQVGHLVEKLLGRWPYTVMYFGSGIVGGLVTLLWHGDQKWSAGASGAVFGVYGALLGYILREKHTVPPKIYQPLAKSTLTFAGYNLFYGFVHPRIDNSAHIGGLIGGLTLGWLLALPVDREIRVRLGPSRLRLGIAVLVAAIGIGVVSAPRFDYSVRERLAWDQTNHDRMAQWSQMFRKQEAALKDYEAGTGSKALTQWLTNEGLPFYENWLNDLEALPLDPKRSTASLREELAKILQLRIESYRHLLEASQRNDRRAVVTFQQEDGKIVERILKFSQRN